MLELKLMIHLAVGQLTLFPTDCFEPLLSLDQTMICSRPSFLLIFERLLPCLFLAVWEFRFVNGRQHILSSIFFGFLIEKPLILTYGRYCTEESFSIVRGCTFLRINDFCTINYRLSLQRFAVSGRLLFFKLHVATISIPIGQ